MKRDDLFIALILCILGITVFFLSGTIQTMLLVERSSIVNSQFYPKLLSLLLVFCGVLLGVQAAVRKRVQSGGPEREEGNQAGGSEGMSRILITGAVSVLYLLLFLPLGFLLSTVLFMAALLVLLGGRTWHGIAIPAILVPVGIYVLFRFLLGVPLPRGVLGFF